MKHDSNFILILNKVLKYIPVALAFLVPIFYLTITTEFFAFNKLALITLATVLLIVLWAVKIMSGQKFEFVKSAMDLPLVTYTIVVVLATIFSVNKTLSIYGSQGRWMGLFALLMLVAYYYLATPVLKELKTIKLAVYAFLTSAILSTIVSLLSYYNIFLSNATYVKIQNFSLAGSTTDTAIIAALAVVMALGLIAYEKTQPIKMGLVIGTVVNILFLMLVNVPAAWAVVGVGVASFIMYANLKTVTSQKFYYTLIAGLTIAVVLLLALPATRNILVSKSYPKEIGLPFKESWLVASSTIQNYPMLSTGPSTFQVNFTRFRPLSLNAGNYWNVRFDKPSNEFFNIMGTLGLIGLIAALFLVGKIARLTQLSKNITDESGITVIVSSAILGLISSLLFTYATITTAFLLVALLSMLIASFVVTAGYIKVTERIVLGTENLASVTSLGDTSAIGKNYVRYIVGAPAILLALYVGYFFFKAYEGEYYMRKAVTAARNNDGSGTYEFQRRAINANPKMDTYQNAYAQTNLALANALAAKKELTDNDKQTIQGLISQAIRTTQVTTEVLNPLSAEDWETRALIYRSLNNVADNASDWAISAYNTAIQLDPTNPRLRLDLGGLYYAKEDYLSAATQFRQATALKSDYANAYYNFAQALLKLNDTTSAKKALEIAKTLVPLGSEDYKKVTAEIAGIPESQGTVAGASTTNTNGKTVEQLTGNQNKGTQKSQEPLNNAAQGQQIPAQNIDANSLPQDQTSSNGSNGATTPQPTELPNNEK